MRSARAWILSLIVAAAVAVLSVSNEDARDLLLHALALGFLVVAIIFQRRVIRSSGAWLPLSAVMMTVAVLTLAMRFWDLMADVDAVGPSSAAEALVLGSKYGERLAFVGMAYFLLRAIRVLQERLRAELRGD